MASAPRGQALADRKNHKSGSRAQMQVVFHLGAHSTDEGRLLRSLLKSRAALAEHDVAVPAPGRYRPLLRDTLASLRGAPASDEVQDALLEAMLDEQRPRRLVVSNEFLLGVAQRVITDQGLLAGSGRRLAALANLFPQAEVGFCLALRNPATLIPAMLARTQGLSYRALMAETRPEALRWPPVLREMRDAVPEAEITVWLNEDTPMIWPEILRTIGGIEPQVPLEGDDDLVAALLPEDALVRLRSYLAEHPPTSVDQRRRVVAAFLERFALPDAVDRDIALPGWDAALIDRITAQYEADWDRIRAMPGLRIIAP